MDSPNPFAPASDASLAPKSWQAEAGSVELPVRTTGLTVIMVLFLLFGIMGAILSCGTMIAWFFEETLQRITNPAGNPVLQKIRESQVAYRIPALVLSIFNTLLSITLIVAAVGIAKRTLWGWNTARVACVAGIFFEIFRLAFAIFLQVLTMMNLSTMDFSKMGENVSEEAAQFTYFSMTVGAVVGMIMGSIYGIGKTLVYYFCKRYLGEPEIARLFG